MGTYHQICRDAAPLERMFDLAGILLELIAPTSVPSPHVCLRIATAQEKLGWVPP